MQPFFDADGEEHYEQAFWGAMVYVNAGDMQGARARIGNFPEELRERLVNEPNNFFVTIFAASYESFLGRNDEAIRLAKRAVEMLPETRDAVDAPIGELVLAMVYARAGDKDHAFEGLGRLSRTPYGLFNVYELRTNGILQALHDDPRFKAMVDDPANNAPLF